jgi:ferredoxin
MVKYKVKYDREACIGAASCTAFSKAFKMAKDGKADLIGAKEIDDCLFELEIDEKEFNEFKEAAQSCPVNVIHIYNEKGEKVI